MSRTMAASSDV